ncbi:MAG: DUF4124 domain-containing protein [Porticoccaceae bacterium]|nr:DUF4124 domain-containing protein [Porticoccaceae bacterium]
MKIVPIFLLLAFVSFGASAGKFYKWEDDEGVVHYTAIAPGHRASETIETQSGKHQPSSSKQADDKTEAEKKAIKGEAELKKAAEPKKSEAAPPTKQELVKTREQTEKNCTQTRKNLETLNTRGRMRFEDPDTGELRYLSPEEITSKKEKAKKNIDEFCN